MAKFVNLTNKQFGMLTVIERAETHTDKSGRKRTRWLCECSCQSKKRIVVDASNLTSGRVISCGCIRNQKASERMKKHGAYGSKIHTAYTNMKQRCTNPNASEYAAYGGRGIKICDEWLGKDGFQNFYDWSIKNGYSDELTIDRIENDGNYEPDNCRWTDMQMQVNNKQDTLYFDVGNGMEPFAELCRQYGIDRIKAWKRLKRGWSIEEALEIKER